MTDATLPVTERAVERFTENYLRSLGAEIRKDGRQWMVSLPDEVDTDLELDGETLEIASDPREVSDGSIAIAPESPFIERILDEAAERAPVGSLALTGDDWGIQLPPWLTTGSVQITEKSFTPYYDRQAICALFHVGIETVSEYQREELHAVAVDINDHEQRPRLAETYLELTDVDISQSYPEGTLMAESALTDALDAAQAAVEDDIRPSVRETQERATRAAEVELDEYREFVYQRRDELTEDVDHLAERIEEVNETIDAAAEQNERVEALRKRKELRSEQDDLRSELENLTRQIERGFPEKRSTIRERHSLTVRIRPVTVTAISYERGELDLTLHSDDILTTTSYSYAIGSGVLDDPICERCGQQLSKENPLTIEGSQLVGEDCCGP